VVGFGGGEVGVDVDEAVALGLAVGVQPFIVVAGR
jgi:hypothetical protein